MSTKSKDFTVYPGLWAEKSTVMSRKGARQQDLSAWQRLFLAQTGQTQRFLEQQGRSLANALVNGDRQASFRLPESVVVEPGLHEETSLPAESRQHRAGLSLNLFATELLYALQDRFDKLESSPDLAVSVAAGLLRFTTASALVHEILPAGHTVRHSAQAVQQKRGLPPTGSSRVTLEASDMEGFREAEVPFTPDARDAFMPQWVVVDKEDRLLSSSLNEGKAALASMQRYIYILYMASSLAPYLSSDGEYQRKRSGMLGQLLDQGRGFARHETRHVIEVIKKRAAEGRLNRGLHLRLPYFDSQSLQMKDYPFEVIPTGWVLFVPAFVVLAAQREMKKVEGDSKLDHPTRQYLLSELQMLAAAFYTEKRT